MDSWTIAVCKCGALSTGHPSGDPEHGFSHMVEVVPAQRLAEVEEKARALIDRCEEMRMNYTDPAGVGTGMVELEAVLSPEEGEA